MDDFREWLSDNLRYFLLGFAILAVVIIAVAGIRIYQRVAGSQKKPTDNIRVESESTSAAGETEAVTEKTSESEKKVVSSEKETEADGLEISLRAKHIKRLTNQQCNTEAGVVFLDSLVCLERISDHARNIAEEVLAE